MQLSTEPVLLYFDSERLETVLCNLLANAFKYTPANGSVALSVTPPVETDERGAGSFATIKIRDNGPGIPQQHLE